VITFIYEYGELRGVRFAIPGYVPRGTVTLIASPRDAGKTTAVVHLAAIGSRAADQCEGCPPVRTWLNTREDDLAAVILPRLTVARAKRDRLVRVTEERWILPDNLAVLDQQLDTDRQTGQPIDMLVLDSISMHMRNCRDNKAARQVMDELNDLAAKYDLAVVLIGHTTKGKGATVESTIAGSPYLQSRAKMIMVYGNEPGGTERKVLACERFGYGAKPDALLFEIESSQIDGLPGDFPHLRYLDTTDWTAEDVLRATQRSPRAGELAAEKVSRTQRALNWIREVLAEDTEMPAAEFEAQARADGAFFSKNTFSAARQLADVESRPPKAGEPGRMVRMPTSQLHRVSATGELGRPGKICRASSTSARPGRVRSLQEICQSRLRGASLRGHVSLTRSEPCMDHGSHAAVLCDLVCPALPVPCRQGRRPTGPQQPRQPPFAASSATRLRLRLTGSSRQSAWHPKHI